LKVTARFCEGEPISLTLKWHSFFRALEAFEVSFVQEIIPV
jgi:hypothetical protein